MKNKILASLTLLPALPFMVTTGLNAQSIEADRDTVVVKGSPDTNYGSDTTFFVRNDGGTGSKEKDQYLYFSFDISVLTETAPGVQLSFELLGLGGGQLSWGYQLYAIPDLGPDEDFDEAALTLNNAHHSYKGALHTGADGSIYLNELDFLGGFTLEDFYDSGADSSTVLFSSELLTDLVNADTNGRVTFILISTAESGIVDFPYFATRENGSFNGPTITIIPEPSTFALMAGALVLLGTALRRRK